MRNVALFFISFGASFFTSLVTTLVVNRAGRK